jgi:hypothetical protein
VKNVGRGKHSYAFNLNKKSKTQVREPTANLGHPP